MTTTTLPDVLSRLNKAEKLLEAGQALSIQLEIKPLLTVINSQIAKLLSPADWSLYWIDKGAKLSVIRDAAGYHSLNDNQLLLAADDPIGQWVMTNRRPLSSPNISGDARFRVLPERFNNYPKGSLLALPLIVENQCFGVLELVHPDAHKFGTEELDLAVPFANILAGLVNNSLKYTHLIELTYADDCTTLYNRRFLDKMLISNVQASLRYGRDLSCIFIDIDHFKQVNDTYGHLIGTRLLSETAQLFRSVIRSCDLAFRYGGDEFVILMTDTDIEEAHLVAKRLLTMLRQHVFLSEQSRNLSITASFGIASLKKDMAPQDLLDAADNCMYWVKQHGRNGIKIAE